MSFLVFCHTYSGKSESERNFNPANFTNSSEKKRVYAILFALAPKGISQQTSWEALAL
jgi:hypothetical protein